MTTAADATLVALADELRREVTERLLPFWMTRAVDRRHGGFVGAIDSLGAVDAAAPKGSILNARILWTFSAAARVLCANDYAVMAQRAKAYVAAQFMDPDHGGVYWMVDAAGRPFDDRKHVYAQAFAIYAFAEHHRATRDASSLHDAVALFELVETHARDVTHGGYHEAFARDWTRLEDVRLSDRDLDAPRSMNTHLHLLEAYTNLYRVWPNATLRLRLTELLMLFLERIIAPNGRTLLPFFDLDWQPRLRTVSYGHDIEASWLLEEAALVAGDAALVERVRTAATNLATAVLEDGVDPAYGGIYNERDEDGTLDMDKEWWPQAEAIVGFARAYRRTGDERFLTTARTTWDFVKAHVVDRSGGEWRRRVTREGVPYVSGEKVGPWKCPYHNGRTCLELSSLSSVR